MSTMSVIAFGHSDAFGKWHACLPAINCLQLMSPHLFLTADNFWFSFSIMTPSPLFLIICHNGKIASLRRTAVRFVICSSTHGSSVQGQGQTQLMLKLFYPVWVYRGWTSLWSLCFLQKHSNNTTNKFWGLFFSCLFHECNIGFMEVVRKFSWKLWIWGIKKPIPFHLYRNGFLPYIPCTICTSAHISFLTYV